jgi:hypothetical protein
MTILSTSDSVFTSLRWLGRFFLGVSQWQLVRRTYVLSIHVGPDSLLLSCLVNLCLDFAAVDADFVMSSVTCNACTCLSVCVLETHLYWVGSSTRASCDGCVFLSWQAICILYVDLNNNLSDKPVISCTWARVIS